MTRTATRFTLPLVAVLLAACSGGGKSTTTAPANVDLTVRAEPGITFDQSSYTVAAHDGKVVISIINDGGVPHNLHIVDGNGDDVMKNAPKLGVTGKGDIATGTFDLPAGHYYVVCKVPGHGTMKSPLTVS